MGIPTWLSGLVLIPLLTLVGCASNNGPDEIDVSLRATYEKRDLGVGGFSTLAQKPARFCFAEVRDAANDGVWASGFLGSDGTAWATVPRGTRVYLKVYAQYEIPATAPGQDFFFRGSVKVGRASASYTSVDAFNALPNAILSGPAVSVDNQATLSVVASESTRENGPFAIADQAVTFGQGVQALEPTLKLPNLHSFWSSSLSAPTPATTFPSLARDASGRGLRHLSGRAVFQHEVRGHATGALAFGADEYNDSKLLESFGHLLFADNSYPEDGRSYGSILRRDNDPVYVARDVQAEPSVAFANGFADFLSCALRNSPVLYDIQPNGSIQSFRLDRHDQFSPVSGQGEFYRGSVAISLWGTWKNSLSGNTADLLPLWNATLGTQANEYNTAPLAAFPTYLVGLKRLLGPSSAAWTGVINQLALENMGDLTQSAYFSSNAFWTNVPVLPFTGSGSLQTYDPAQARYYDRNQGIAFRFQQTSTSNRSFTVQPTGGQDVWLELLGPGGYVLDTTGQPFISSADTRVGGVPQPRTLSVNNLPPGDYVVRVRVGYTSANNPAASFSLTIQ